MQKKNFCGSPELWFITESWGIEKAKRSRKYELYRRVDPVVDRVNHNELITRDFGSISEEAKITINECINASKKLPQTVRRHNLQQPYSSWFYVFNRQTLF